jgi:hypothetical protein
MFSNLSRSLAAAFALSAATGGVARADPVRAGSHDPTNEEIDAAETGNPDSIDYANRRIGSHSATNAEINGAETGNPDSPNYRNRPVPGSDRNWKAEWQALDADTPANPQPGKGAVRAAPAGDPTATSSAK